MRKHDSKLVNDPTGRVGHNAPRVCCGKVRGCSQDRMTRIFLQDSLLIFLAVPRRLHGPALEHPNSGFNPDFAFVTAEQMLCDISAGLR